MSFDRVWMNANLATMGDDALGIVEDGAIAAKDGRIAYAGPRAGLPAHSAPVTDCQGAWILPGLIDCHTHMIFGGNRSGEFEARLAGASYEEIARAGGGILSTMRATREASAEALVNAALPRLDALLREGVTTVEIKSGYGLELGAELKQLAAARALEGERAVSIVTSLLAAHAVPPEYTGRQAEYARLVAEEILPRAASEGLADAVDAFCENIAFTPEETAMVFEAARSCGLPVKLHADQLTDCGGAALAARFQALSADHLERSNAEGIAAMAAAGTVAVLLPGATLTLRERHFPDVATMRATGCRMALSTDMNPGSSPALSLLLMLNLGCTLFRLTVREALLGVTRHAAAALGMKDRGVLAEGMRCDLALYAVERPAELCYWLGGNPCIGRVVAGEPA
jgi:imidazolonepropionase